MQLKNLSLLALITGAFAQQSNNTGTLNATLASNPSLSNLTTFLNSSPELIQTLNTANNVTIIAPSNEAFASVLNGSSGQALSADPSLVGALLTYHILQGTFSAAQITNQSVFVPTLLTNTSYSNVTGGQVVEAVTVANSTYFFSGLLQNTTVTQADVNFTGGVIHIVDRVLTLPTSVNTTASSLNLTAFRGALNATNLTSTVDTTPDLTIFAPNNNAFQSIGSALANLSVTDLVGILGYHVINGSVIYSTDLENGTSVQTLGGGNLTCTIEEDGSVFINSARVVTPNVLVANGVVHIIDNVLNPNATDGRPSASATTGAPGFTGASSASDVPFTSGQPTPTTTVNPTSQGAGPASTARSSSTGAAVPMRTGAVGAAALFGGAAVLMAY